MQRYRKAVYPGTFDPITIGHADIIRRATLLFDHITVAIAVSVEKNPMFTLEERIEMTELAIKEMNLSDKVGVKGFKGLLVDFAKEQESLIIIRGLRAVSDFEYELQMGYANASLDPKIETVHLMSSLQHAFISSTVVRTVLKHGGDISHLVTPEVKSYLESH